MKVCEYCGTQCKNEITVCEACGGNSFVYQCRNCGAQYKEGVACPACGVRRDALPKRCPRCGGTYYTPACPACGYDVPGQSRGAPSPERQTPQVRQNRIWLWVLAFFFCFPAAFTVLIVRSAKFSKELKIVLIVIVWLFYGLLIFLGNR